MDNSERFMQAFRSIESYLRKINEDYRIDGFARSLRDASKSDKTLRNYLDILLEYAELRNAIVHTLTSDGKPIAEPHKEVVENIEHVAKMLNAPPRVSTIFKSGKVVTIDLNDTVDKALKIIGEKSFSQIPVYEGRQFRGILTTNAIARWMAFVGEEERACIKDMPIRAVMDYAEEDEAVEFVSRKATLFEIAASFSEFSALGKRLEAILVTENGKRSETPLQIITIWDIPLISETLNS